MSVLDIVARNVASSMIGKFGQTVRLHEEQSGNYDSATDTAAIFGIDHDVPAVVVEFGANEIRGLVKSGDKKVLVAAKDLPRVPRVNWTLKIGSRWYTIRHVTTSYSGDDPAVHEIVARGAA